MNKEIVNDGTNQVPGLGWKVSEETIKEIQDLEEQQRVALAHFWHFYV